MLSKKHKKINDDIPSEVENCKSVTKTKQPKTARISLLFSCLQKKQNGAVHIQIPFYNKHMRLILPFHRNTL